MFCSMAACLAYCMEIGSNADHLLQEELRPVLLGRSGQLRVGQQCLALGNPFGEAPARQQMHSACFLWRYRPHQQVHGFPGAVHYLHGLLWHAAWCQSLPSFDVCCCQPCEALEACVHAGFDHSLTTGEPFMHHAAGMLTTILHRMFAAQPLVMQQTTADLSRHLILA